MNCGAYRHIHSSIDETVSHLSGLSYALSEMAREASCITHGSKEANAIMTMINMIEEKVEDLEKAQEEAWKVASTAAWPTEVSA